MSTPEPGLALAAPALRDPRAQLLRWLLARLAAGRLTVETPAGETIVIASGRPGPEATLILARWRAVYRMLAGGALGFADAYLGGDWSSPDLVALLRLAARNRDKLAERLQGAAPVRAAARLRHRLCDNTRRGARKNVAAHYDLGNAFYRLWLDRGMAYSSALFGADESLEQAQDRKNRRIVELLGLRGGENVLEIGCGWGGLALQLAGAGAARVKAITLSREQQAYAAARAAAEGMSARVEVSILDYRDVAGAYDRIASIEMIEAVGEPHWPAYFAALRDRLKTGGVAVIQAITIDDARFAAYRRGTDFIQRHIFPGGMLPSPGALRDQIARAGLALASVETFGPSYARTLAEWQRRFQAAWPEIAAQGFAPRFKRMWEYYLAYCEAGFREAAIDVGLYRIVKPGSGRV